MEAKQYATKQPMDHERNQRRIQKSIVFYTHTHARSKCSNIKAVNILVKFLSYQSLRTDKREVNVLMMGEELRKGLQIHH